MSALKKCGFFIAVFLLIVRCNQPKNFDVPALKNPARALAGEYEGKIGLRMDESRPLNEYPGTFTVTPVEGTDFVMLSTSVKPGAMPFFVNYTLQKPSPLRSSSIGYTLGGSFKVDVTLGNGRKKDMPEFYFTINERSRITRDSEGSYWLELYYPDQKMANGKVLPGERFFRGKQKK